MTNPVSPPLIALPADVRPVRSARLLFLAIGLTLVPTLAFAQGTPEQQQACTPDALRLCAATIPDVPKTTACMKAHVAQLSPRCQAAFNDATTPKAASKLAELKAAESKATRAHVKSQDAKPRVAAREERRPPRTVVASRQEARRQDRQDERRVPGRDTVRANKAPRPLARAPRADEPDEALGSPVVVRGPALAGYSLAAPNLDGTRVTLSNMCRRGLIDAYTCTNTVPSLGLGD